MRLLFSFIYDKRYLLIIDSGLAKKRGAFETPNCQPSTKIIECKMLKLQRVCPMYF